MNNLKMESSTVTFKSGNYGKINQAFRKAPKNLVKNVALASLLSLGVLTSCKSNPEKDVFSLSEEKKEKLFLKADLNENNEVSFDEYKFYHGSCLNDCKKEMFSLYDKDKSNSLDKEEFGKIEDRNEKENMYKIGIFYTTISMMALALLILRKISIKQMEHYDGGDDRPPLMFY